MADIGTYYPTDGMFGCRADRNIAITLKGKIGYEDEITAAQAAQIIAFLNSDHGEASQLGGPAAPVQASTAKSVENAREAILRSGAKTNPEKIVALAAYVLQDGGETVKADAIKSQFQRARQPMSAKFTRDLSSAISAGWLSESDGGELYLTNKVTSIFEEGFQFPKAKPNGRSRPANNRSTGKSMKPNTLDDIGEFHAVMEGYPPYSKLKFEKDRLLWIVTYMREKQGRATVTPKEIAWISDHIGTGIPSGNIAGAFNGAKKSGYAIRSTTAGDKSIKVTEAGTQYLSSLGEGAGA